VAYRLDKVDGHLDLSMDEGELRLCPLRAVLRRASKDAALYGLVDADSDNSVGAMLASKLCSKHGNVIVNRIMSSTHKEKPTANLVCSNLKILSVSEADCLEKAERAKCIPIQNTDTLALPLNQQSNDVEPRVIIIFPELTGGTRSASVEICREGSNNIFMTIVSCLGIRRHFSVGNIDKLLLDNLFRRVVSSSLLPNVDTPTSNKELPGHLKRAIANFLQRRVRLQVSCTASMPAPIIRPVAIEKAYMRNQNKSNNKWMCITAQLHPSSSSCICSKYKEGSKCESSVEVKFETCGRPLQEDCSGRKRCPCHENAIDKNGNARFSMNGVCLESTSFTVTCRHFNDSIRPRRQCLDSTTLTKEDKIEISNILVNMSEYKSQTSNAFKNMQIMDKNLLSSYTCKYRDIFEKTASRIKQNKTILDTEEMIRRDSMAVDLIRRGDVFRKRRQEASYLYISKRHKNKTFLTPNQQIIASTHAHLFHKYVTSH
jgi:hypothetical protein